MVVLTLKIARSECKQLCELNGTLSNGRFIWLNEECMQIHTINVEKYGFCPSEFATVMSAIIILM